MFLPSTTSTTPSTPQPKNTKSFENLYLSYHVSADIPLTEPRTLFIKETESATENNDGCLGTEDI